MDSIILKIKSKNIKAYLIIGFFLLFINVVVCQNQKVSDSLKTVLLEENFDTSKKLEIIGNIAANETNTDEILIYSKQLIDLAIETNSIKYVYDGYLQIGNAYRLKSDLTKALENYFKALKIAENNNLISDQGTVKIAIADVYSIVGDNKNAVEYYKQSIQLLKSSLISKNVSFLDSINLASAQLNLGDEYYNQQKLDSALIYFGESMKLFKATNYELGEAYNVSSNTAYSIQYLLDTLLSYTDVDITVEIDEAKFRPIDVPIVQGDNSRLQQLTGWQPTIGFEKTLYDLLEDCRERVQKTMRSNK